MKPLGERPGPVLYMDRGSRKWRTVIGYAFVIVPTASLLAAVALFASTDRPLGWLTAAFTFLAGVAFLTRAVPRWLDRTEEGDIDRLHTSLLFVTMLSLGGAGITLAVVSNLTPVASPSAALADGKCIAAITALRQSVKDDPKILASRQPFHVLLHEMGCSAESLEAGFTVALPTAQ